MRTPQTPIFPTPVPPVRRPVPATPSRSWPQDVAALARSRPPEPEPPGRVAEALASAFDVGSGFALTLGPGLCLAWLVAGPVALSPLVAAGVVLLTSPAWLYGMSVGLRRLEGPFRRLYEHFDM